MTPTTLAETILRDVPRHDAYDVMMTLDGHPLPSGCAFGKWVRHADVLAALTAALDPAIAERAGAVLSRLRPYAWAYSASREAADLITALLAQNAAQEAEADRYLRHLTAGAKILNAYKARAEAAEAQIAALTARVEGLTGAGSNLVAQLYQMWTEARDHRDRSALGSAEYAIGESIASALRDAYLASRSALTTDASTQKGGDAHAVDPRHAPHEASPGVTAGADAAHVNETPKSEHDAGNVLTAAP